MIDLDELKKIAEDHCSKKYPEYYSITDEYTKAFTPQTVLALIEKIHSLRMYIDGVHSHRDMSAHHTKIK